MAKIGSWEANNGPPKAILTPHLQTPRDTATKNGEKLVLGHMIFTIVQTFTPIGVIVAEVSRAIAYKNTDTADLIYWYTIKRTLALRLSYKKVP